MDYQEYETIKKYYPRADFQSCIIHAE
jgi:hypothetical protein